MLEFFAIVLCAYFVLCVVACIFQPKTPLPSLTETYKTLTIENEIEEVLIEGRQKFPPYKKLNLVWWFLNEYESTPPDWYHRGQNFWLRLPSWYIRNPFQNAGNYVFGVCDRNFTVRGPARRCGRPTTISTRRAPGSSGRSSASAACDCRSSRM